MPTELLVSRTGRQIWAALREDGDTVELRVERDGRGSRAGRVIKGRVVNVVPAIQSAFVDVGGARHAFLHANELLPRKDVVDAGAGAPIERRVRNGEELLVQVVRESPESKGDRVSCRVGIPGRFLVLLPNSGQHGVSRRIEEGPERDRLTGILERLGADEAFVARTSARGVTEDVLRAEARRLRESWESIAGHAARASAPCTLYREPPLPLALVRDASNDDIRRIVMDDARDRDDVVDYLQRADPALAERVELLESDSVYEAYGLARHVEKALRPRVWLRSGGYVVIEQTEALVSVDVNTGRSVSGRQHEATVLETNLEACREIARQLRLRDLGGIVVIDFIDMPSEDHRRQVEREFRQAVGRDRARTKIFGLGELGLLQLTRKRTHTGLLAEMTDACASCQGHGWTRRPEIVSAEIFAELRRQEAGRTSRTVRAHPTVAAELRQDLEGLADSGRQVPQLEIVEDPALPQDRFSVH